MKSPKVSLVILLLAPFFLSGCGILRTVGIYRPTAAEKMAEFKLDVTAKKFSFELPPRTRVDTIKADSAKRVVEIEFNDALSYVPYRTENVKEIYRQVQLYFADYFEGYSFSVRSLKQPIEQLVPNYFRADTSLYDRSRMPLAQKERPHPVVQNISKPFVPSKGLFNRNIGLWHSHGWYYNRDLDRWEWQRPRVFMMVEILSQHRSHSPI